MTGEGLQILTYARHLWTLSSESSLACHTYCHTEHPDDPSAKRFSSGAVTTWFYDLGLSRLRFEHQTFRLQGKRPNPLRHCCGN